MPNARWAIDHFHVVMKANEAVDVVRREIQKGIALLRFLTAIRNAPTDSFARITCVDVDILLKSYAHELYTEKQTFVQCLKTVL